METIREEVTFKDHRISELEQAVLKEKEHVTKMEGEVQVGVVHVRRGGGVVCVGRMGERGWVGMWVGM